MSLLYRTIFSAPHLDIVDDAADAFGSWIDSKGIGLSVPKSGSVTASDAELVVTRATADQLKAIRLTLHEERIDERWSTTVTAIDDGVDPCVWIDLERVSSDPYGRPPIVAVPRVVETLLQHGDCHVGPTKFAVIPELVDAAATDELIKQLLDPERRVPLIVMSKDRYATVEGALERGGQLLKKVLGLAPVFVLEAEASAKLETALGPDLKVYGGAVRSYLPELTIPDRQPERHPFIAGTIFSSQTANAASRIQRTLTQQAIAQRPPAIYRERVAMMPGFPHHQGGAEEDDELVAELVDVERERDSLLGQLRELQDELEYSALQLEEAESELDSAQARVRYLEGRLRAANDQAAYEATPAASIPETAESCTEAVGFARQYLTGVELGDTDYPASGLDTYAKSGSWAKKAWRVFRSMEDYAELKANDEFAGDFLAYCKDSPQGRTVVPAGWVALKESVSTDNNPKYRSARTFPVPAEVSEDEEMYMCAHVRLEAGGRPAPRIHFYDDTSGPTGVIYVGYFGEHLPNDQTN